MRQAGKDLGALLVQQVRGDSQDSLGHRDPKEIQVPQVNVVGQVALVPQVCRDRRDLLVALAALVVQVDAVIPELLVPLDVLDHVDQMACEENKDHLEKED